MRGIRERFNVADLPAHFSEGGEAVIYCDPMRWPGRALKLFLDPDEEDFTGNPQAAREKLREIQTKLTDFPSDLHERVIVPLEGAIDPDARGGKRIAGYYMRYVSDATQLQHFAEKPYLDKLGADTFDIFNETILPVFRDLHHTVSRLHEHEAGIVIGDFSDTNVLVQGAKAYLVDTDSFGFGKYPARFGKPDFMDPLLAGRDPCQDGDWYAYTVLLLQTLLRVKPYGGTYLPKKLIPAAERIRQRISVFHDDVSLPQWAMSTNTLPDNLFAYFAAVFGKEDKRGPFPAYLLDMYWQRCRSCGLVHARSTCPKCQRVPRMQSVKRGGVTAVSLFKKSECSIAVAAYHNKQLRYLYLKNGLYMREDGSRVIFNLAGTDFPVYHNPELALITENFKILGQKTLFHLTNRKSPQYKILYVCDPQSGSRNVKIPIFHTNSHGIYGVEDDTIFRIDKSGNVTSCFTLDKSLLEALAKAIAKSKDLSVPHVSKKQLHISVGEKIGIVYEEGLIYIGRAEHGQYFVTPICIFDTQNGEPRNGVKYPRTYVGSLVDHVCYIDGNIGWFLMTLRTGTTLTNYCLVINTEGKLLTSSEALSGSDNWLGEIQGKCALSHSLLTPTDGGIVQVTLAGQELETGTYRETAGFVDAQTKLLGGETGIYAVKAHEIMELPCKVVPAC